MPAKTPEKKVKNDKPRLMTKYAAALPYIVAVLIFIILSAVYFYPQLEGYALNQHDIKQHIGMSKEIVDFRKAEKQEPLWTNSAFGGMPAYQISMSSPNVMTRIEDIFLFKIFNAPMGYLILAMISFYILMLCFGVNPWMGIIGAVAFGFSSIHMVYLAGGHNSKVHAIALLPGIIGSLMYAYRKSFRTGGLLLCLFVCLQVSANHIQETYYLLFLIAGIIIWEFFRFYKERRLPAFARISAFLLIAAIIGTAPALSNLLLTNEYAKYTNRGKSDLSVSARPSEDKSVSKGLERNYIKEYSMGYGEVWSLAIPNVKGGASGRLGDFRDKLEKAAPENREYISNFPCYWGEQAGSGGAFYFGAAVFLLFVLGMVFIKDRIKWVFLAVSALAIVLSWKYSAILDFFIDHFPLFNKFRDTKMILVLIQIIFSLVGLLFLNGLLKTKPDKKKLYITIGATIGVFLLFYILPSLWFGFFNKNELMSFDKQAALYPQAVQQINSIKADIETVRIAIFRADVLRSVFFMAAVALCIILYTRQKKVKPYFIAVIGILVLLDIWTVDKRYLNNDHERRYWIKAREKSTPFRPSVADNQILSWEMADNTGLKEKIEKNINQLQSSGSPNMEVTREEMAFSTLNLETDYRVLSLDNPFANAVTSYYHKSLGGYHGAKLKRYAELTDFRMYKESQMIIDALKSNKDSLLGIVLRDYIPVINMLNTKYIIGNPDAPPVRNPYANGTAWMVQNVKLVENADTEMKALDSVNPKFTAIVDKVFSDLVPRDLKYDTAATIHQTLYRPNYLVYETNSESEQVGVFSEIYYKDGWNAYIDGKQSPYFRADYVLRAMAIPKGKHKVEFKFEPKTYYLSKKLSLAGSISIVLFAIGVLFFEVRNRRKKG